MIVKIFLDLIYYEIAQDWFVLVLP